MARDAAIMAQRKQKQSNHKMAQELRHELEVQLIDRKQSNAEVLN